MEREADELFAEYTAGEYELFASPTDLSDAMPYQLSWSTPDSWCKLSVFWSREEDNELQGLLGSLYPSDYTGNSSRNTTIREKIKAALQSVCFCSDCGISKCLIQFWAPVQTGDVIYLTTANQCFGLTTLDKGLCSYRRSCVSSMLLPVHVNELDDEEELNFGPIARVFRLGRDEWIINHTTELGVQVYTVWPLFEKAENECIGVVEILSTRYGASFLVYDLVSRLKGMGLTPYHESFPGIRDVSIILGLTPYDESFPGIHDVAVEMQKVHKVMDEVCLSHRLPHFRVWAGSSTRSLIHRTFFCFQANPHMWQCFEGAFPLDSLGKGRGVAGKAFASCSACFCRDVSKLSMARTEIIGLLTPNAGELLLTACFAVCLQSIQVDNFYILEFFLPLSETDHADPRNLVKVLVASLKMKIQSSLGDQVQNFGEKLFVEVIKTSPNDELDSFEVCDTEQITRGTRIGFGNYSEVRWDNPISVPEVDVDLQLSLGPWTTNAIRSYSEVQSNSLSSDQEMSLDVHLVRPSSTYSVKEISVRQDSRQDMMEDDSTAFSYVRDYSKVQQRSSSSDTSRLLSNSDPDFAEFNAFTQILRRDNVRF